MGNRTDRCSEHVPARHAEGHARRRLSWAVTVRGRAVTGALCSPPTGLRPVHHRRGDVTSVAPLRRLVVILFVLIVVRSHSERTGRARALGDDRGILSS